MKIGILAVQGAFAEHENVLSKLGAEFSEIRQESDAAEHYDGLILPGGESTVQGKLLFELNLFHPLLNMIKSGVPVLATCAGMILLADKIEGQFEVYFGAAPITVRRNAYGRQLGSFHTEENFLGIGTVPMTFIRAPYVTDAGGAEVMAESGGKIVAIRYKNMLALSFHPELDDDLRIHKSFLDMCEVRS